MLVLLQTAFPRYEHAHSIDELFLARAYSRFTFRLPHGVNIKGGFNHQISNQWKITRKSRKNPNFKFVDTAAEGPGKLRQSFGSKEQQQDGENADLLLP